MQKRGLSGVITVVLLILIILIAISIVWLFVKPAITDIIGGQDSGGEYQKFISCNDLNLKAESCSYNNESLKVRVERGSGSQEITTLAFQFPNEILSLEDGSGKIPGEFGSSIITFLLSTFTEIPKNVKVTAVLSSGQACQFNDIPVPCNPENPEDYICGDGICQPGENETTCPQDCSTYQFLFSPTGEDINQLSFVGASPQLFQEFSAYVHTVRKNFYTNTLCKYPPYGTNPDISVQLQNSCNGLDSFKTGIPDFEGYNLNLYMQVFSNNLWIGDLRSTIENHEEPIIRALNTAEFQAMMNDLDSLIARFETGTEDINLLKAEYDANITSLEEYLTQPGSALKEGIPAIPIRSEREEYQKWIIKETLESGKRSYNIIPYLQIGNEITALHYNLGDENQYLYDLSLGRKAIEEVDWTGYQKPLLISGGAHSKIPLMIQCAYDPNSNGIVQEKYANGSLVSSSNCNTWIGGRGNKLATAGLDYTGNPSYNDWVDLHIYRNPGDTIDYYNIINSYLTDPDWNDGNNPRINSQFSVTVSEFDGSDARTDQRFYDWLPANGSDWTGYNDTKYRIYQTEDIFSRQGAALFSKYPFVLRGYAYGQERSPFGPMSLYTRRINRSDGGYMDESYFHTPAWHSFTHFVEFSKNFMRADKIAGDDFTWDDSYFLGFGFVSSDFIPGTPSGEVYPVLIVWSRTQKSNLPLQDLWNSFLSGKTGDSRGQFWESGVNFSKPVWVFRPDYPLTGEYYLEDGENPSYVETDKKVYLATNKNPSVNETPRIYIIQNNVL